MSAYINQNWSVEVRYARNILSQLTGLTLRAIPHKLGEAKAMQMRVKREIHRQSVTPKPRRGRPLLYVPGTNLRADYQREYKRRQRAALKSAATVK